MAVKFVSKFSKFKIYVNGKKVVFTGGVLVTDDKDTIDSIRGKKEFGFTVVEAEKIGEPSKKSELNEGVRQSVSTAVSEGETTASPEVVGAGEPAVKPKKKKKGK